MKKRIVIKIGSSSLTEESGGIDQQKIIRYVRGISSLHQAGHEVVLVSSGAIAAGFTRIGYGSRPQDVACKQAAAAVGQALLMQNYVDGFFWQGIVAAQMLLTRPDFQNGHQRENAAQALQELLRQGVVPIINENDCTSIAELTFGDNDLLSALVSGLVEADLLVILTDVDGIYDANPADHADAKKFHRLFDIPESLLQMDGESGSEVGTGGMKTKIGAAHLAHRAGIEVFIGKLEAAAAIQDIVDGRGNGTYICAKDGTVRVSGKGE